MSPERPGHTLGAKALVHEVYLPFAGQTQGRWADPGHFYRAAAEAMRHLLIDHARARGRDKRGGGHGRVPLTQATDVTTLGDAADPDDVLALDAAVVKLEGVNHDAADMVRLVFYNGLPVWPPRSTRRPARSSDGGSTRALGSTRN